jgi:hypothetical protein
MTYIILKATELLAVRDPNVHARYHVDIHHRDINGKKLKPHEVSPYLKRLCEVNIITRATPAIHGDVSVTESLSSYYQSHKGVDSEEAKADAHDYCSIGCIEENSAAWQCLAVNTEAMASMPKARIGHTGKKTIHPRQFGACKLWTNLSVPLSSKWTNMLK